MSADPEADYYQTVEEYFVSRRGDPLFLSNAEWNIVRQWRLAGLPLRIVLRGIRDALDAHALGWNRERKVKSLALLRGRGGDGGRALAARPGARGRAGPGRRVGAARLRAGPAAGARARPARA